MHEPGLVQDSQRGRGTDDTQRSEERIGARKGRKNGGREGGRQEREAGRRGVGWKLEGALLPCRAKTSVEAIAPPVSFLELHDAGTRHQTERDTGLERLHAAHAAAVLT